MVSKSKLVECTGCHALVPDMPAFYGPAHTYLGASAGCWQIYGELTARRVPNMIVRGLMADTYMVQHPGVASRQAIQSVARHLMGLHCSLELHLPFEQGVEVMKKAPVAQFVWLEPPTTPGSLTAVDMVRAFDEEVETDLVKEWAVTTWQAWEIHHPMVRHWVNQALAKNYSR
jgi:hypothetical protein